MGTRVDGFSLCALLVGFQVSRVFGRGFRFSRWRFLLEKRRVRVAFWWWLDELRSVSRTPYLCASSTGFTFPFHVVFLVCCIDVVLSGAGSERGNSAHSCAHLDRTILRPNGKDQRHQHF